MIKVLLADNQRLTNEGVTSMISGMIDIHIAGNARHAAELEQMLIKIRPEVIIIDPDYNHRFTIADLKEIVSRFDFTRILVLTNRQSRNKVLEITNAGIKNIVFKECSREELIHAIYTAAKGEQFFCKATFETLFGNKLLPEKEHNAFHLLSSRETELIRLIAEGMTNKEIAEKLFLSVHTIKTHRKNIIKKLGFTFKNTTELALLIQQDRFI
ncbi:response regulator transcription factor [Mucilaginibacter sp. AW1-3]